MSFNNIKTRLGQATESDLDNTTTTPLSSEATYTGTWSQSDLPDVMVSCQADNTGTLYFDFSNDGGSNVNTFPTAGFSVVSGIHEFHIAVKGSRSFRVRLVNDTGAQSYLRLYTYFGSFQKPNAPLNQALGSDSDATTTKSVIAGENSDGNYENVSITLQNELLTNTYASNFKSSVHYDASVTQNAYAIFIDLSDTTNFPHSNTNFINLDTLSVGVQFATGTADSEVKIGVITRIDGVDADISYLQNFNLSTQSANENKDIFHNYQPSGLKFEVSGGSLVGAITNDTESSISAVNTGITLDSPNGSIAPAVGDVILKFVYVADTYNATVQAVYHSE